MKIVVLLKQTPDTESRIKIDASGQKLDLAGVKSVVNPYDEYAVEEAVRIKEKIDPAAEIVIVSVGPASVKELMVKCLAVGADRGLHIEVVDSGFNPDSRGVVELLAKVIESEKPDLVLAGRHAIDDNNMHVTPMVAERLGWPHVNVVGKLAISGGKATVERAVEGGQIEIYEATLPCVLGADKSLNTPRYAKLPDIMKAKKKPVDTKKPSDFGVEWSASSDIEILGFSYPPEKSAGKIFQDESVQAMTDKLATALRQEAKII
jgi:electron transfer flavoprotein beta subunit